MSVTTWTLIGIALAAFAYLSWDFITCIIRLNHPERKRNAFISAAGGA